MNRAWRPVVHALAGVVLLGGCVSKTFEATTGRVYQEGVNPSSAAALASAARDLPCDRPSITLVERTPFYSTGQAYTMIPTVAEGCGKRVTYQIVHSEPANDLAARFVVASRVAIPASTGTPAPSASAAARSSAPSSTLPARSAP